MLHSIWLACCVIIATMILLRAPSQDASGLQSIALTSGTNNPSSSNSQPIDKFIWSLIFIYLILSIVAFR